MPTETDAKDGLRKMEGVRERGGTRVVRPGGEDGGNEEGSSMRGTWEAKGGYGGKSTGPKGFESEKGTGVEEGDGGVIWSSRGEMGS